MKKPTQQQLAELYHVSRPTISLLKKHGIDIYDKEAVKVAILKQNHRPKAWVGGCPWEKKESEDPEISDTDKNLDDLEKLAMDAKDYDEARFARTKIQALKEYKQVLIQDREYIHRDEITEDMMRIGKAMQAAHNKMQADLPAMLCGLDEAEMQEKIKDYTIKLDAQLSDETGELYQ